MFIWSTSKVSIKGKVNTQIECFFFSDKQTGWLHKHNLQHKPLVNNCFLFLQSDNVSVHQLSETNDTVSLTAQVGWAFDVNTKDLEYFHDKLRGLKWSFRSRNIYLNDVNMMFFIQNWKFAGNWLNLVLNKSLRLYWLILSVCFSNRKWSLKTFLLPYLSAGWYSGAVIHEPHDWWSILGSSRSHVDVSLNKTQKPRSSTSMCSCLTTISPWGSIR